MNYINDLELWNCYIKNLGNEEFSNNLKFKELFIKRFENQNDKRKITVKDIAKLLGETNEKSSELMIRSADDNLRQRLKKIFNHFEAKYEIVLPQKNKSDELKKWLEKNKYPKWKKEYLEKIYPEPTGIYIERNPTRDELYQEFLNPGAFVRLKAPQKMGKAILVNHVLVKLKRNRYQIIEYDFSIHEQDVFKTYDRFIDVFCAGIAKRLKIKDKWLKHKLNNSGINDNILFYFTEYLFSDINRPVIIVLKRLERLFEYPKIAEDFCSLLRALHNASASTSGRPREIFSLLHIVITHSTDCYGVFDINESPLANVGKVYTLSEFNFKAVKIFANNHQFVSKIDDSKIRDIMNLIGGNPYLLKRTFEYLEKHEWISFVENTLTRSSPFYSYLDEQVKILNQNQELKRSFRKVINSSEPIILSRDSRFQLEGMGLILVRNHSETHQNICVPRCSLYRQYFSTHLN